MTVLKNPKNQFHKIHNNEAVIIDDLSDKAAFAFISS